MPRAIRNPQYAELHTLSNFSFLRGASHPEELVEQAKVLGYRALALTDECSLAGVVRAHGAAKNVDLALIVGSEFELECGLRMVLLAPDRQAYANLATLITIARGRAPKGQYLIKRADFEQGADGCLALLLSSPPSYQLIRSSCASISNTKAEPDPMDLTGGLKTFSVAEGG